MNDVSENRIRLFPNVISTKGYNRSTLIDLLYGNLYVVPNGLIDYLESNEGEQTYSEEEKELISEYSDFILEKEIGIIVSNDIGLQLEELPINYFPHAKLNNSILELDSSSNWNLANAVIELDSCGTQFLEIRFLDYTSFESNFVKIKKIVESTTIESIHMLVPFDCNLKLFLDTNLFDFLRLYKITVYNSSIGFELENGFNNIIFSSQREITHNECGNVSVDNFVISTSSYVKNRNANSCLSHKLSINKEGLICNCPSLNSSYGNIDSMKITDVLEETNFRQLWNITKEEVSICSLCEFRWICSDCRVFTVKDSQLGKPSKCGYNPFISLWSNEKDYLSEKECGIVFDKNEISIDKELLESINQKIWG